MRGSNCWLINKTIRCADMEAIVSDRLLKDGFVTTGNLVEPTATVTLT